MAFLFPAIPAMRLARPAPDAPAQPARPLGPLELAAGLLVHLAMSAFDAWLLQHPGSIAPVAYANAVGAMLLARAARSQWPWLAACLVLAGLGASIAAGQSPHLAAAQVPGSLVEMLLAAVALRWLHRRDRDLRGVPALGWALLIAGGLPALAGGSLRAIACAAAGGPPLASSWLAWTSGSVAGAAAVLPLGLVWLRGPWRPTRARLAQLAAGLAVLAVGVALAPRPLLFCALLLVTLALLQGRLPGTAAATFAAAVLLNAGTAAGHVRPAVIAGDTGPWLYLSLLGMLVPAPLLAAALEAQGAALARLRSERAQLAALARNVPGVLYRRRIRPDGTGTFDFLSEKVTELFGAAADVLRTHDLPALLAPAEAERFRIEAARATAARGDLGFEASVTRADATILWVRVLSHFSGHDGADLLYDGLFLDVTAEVTQREQLALVLAAGGIGCWRWDVATDTISGDARCARLLGRAAQPIAVGRAAFGALVHVEDRDAVDAQLQACAAGRAERFGYEHRLAAGDGRWRWVRCQGTALARDAAGRALYLSGTVLDITDLKAAQCAAEGASAAKSAFLARMSHELRTPLNGVLGCAHLMLAEARDASVRELASRQLEAGTALLALIDDVLDFSKIEAGKLALEYAPFEPAALIRGALQMVRPLAQARTLALDADIDPRLATARVGDAARIRQVLLNLLSNALKFTEAGGARVAARLLPAADGGLGRLHVTVHDSGIGIAPDALPRLFAPFEQARGRAARHLGGTGLGLAISRQLVEAMGGAIGVASTPGVGSSFWFELPLPPTPAQAATSAMPQAAAISSVRALRLLLVEDDELSRLVAARLLERSGHTVRIVGDGIEALAALAETPDVFDAVLMDVRMPRMDGLEATRRIRARADALARMPIIGLTADVLREDLERCLVAGMNHVLTKPIDPERLAQALNEAVRAAAHRCPRPSGSTDRAD